MAGLGVHGIGFGVRGEDPGIRFRGSGFRGLGLRSLGFKV